MDAAWLRKIGVSGPDAEISVLVERIDSVLELRVGTIISDALTDDQLSEFEQLMDDGASEAVRLAWIEAAYPDYKKVVSRETANLRAAIRRSKHKVAYIGRLEA